MSREVVLSLAKVTREFLSKGREPVEPSDRIFPPVDIDNIRNDTKPQIKGQEEGDAGIPFKQATALSATENAILAEFERVQHIYINTHDRMQSAYVTRVNALAHEWKLDAIENEEEEKVNKVIARAKQQANEILRPMEKLRASGRELLKYRELHNLTGRLPVPVSQSKYWTVLIIVMAVELIVSFLLIQESGDPQRVVVLALIFAALNSFLPAFFGNLSIWLNYCWGLKLITNSKKIIGWLILSASICLGALINLMMAHYRSLSMEVAEESIAMQGDLAAQQQIVERLMSLSADSLTRLQQQGFDLGDTWSYILLFIGAICFLVAFREGFNKGDTYPNYTKLSNAFDDHFDEYQNTVEEVIERLKTDQANAVKEINILKKDITESYAKVPEIIARSVTLSNNCITAISALDTRLMQLVQEYRTANLKSRSDDAPEYFNETLTLREQPVASADFPNLDEGVKTELEDTLSNFVETIHEKFRGLINDIPEAETVLEKYPLKVE